MEIILRPLTFLALFGLAVLISWALHKVIPAGRVKDALYKPMHVIPRNEAERRDWKPVWLFFGASLLVFAWIFWLIK